VARAHGVAVDVQALLAELAAAEDGAVGAAAWPPDSLRAAVDRRDRADDCFLELAE